METLRGCFLSTELHKLELDEATETIIDYINFCVDGIIDKKEVLHFPNNKTFISNEVKASIGKKMAFGNKDGVGVATAQGELKLL